MNRGMIILFIATRVSLATAAEIPANTWTELTPEDCTGELCSQPHPEFRAYSGSAIGNGYIWWWGGGHKAGPYNSIDAYDIAENRWEQLTTAEDIRDTEEWDHLTAEEKEAQINTWGAGRGPLYWSPLGRFVTDHSYGWQLWNPGREEFCGLWAYPEENYPVYACYDPARGDESGEPAASGTDPSQPDGAFSIVSENVPDWKSAGHAVGLTWDSTREQVVMVNTSGRSGVWRYDEFSDSWDVVADFLIKGDGKYNEGYIEHHPGMDVYFTARKRQGMQIVDAETGEATLIANPPTSLLTYSLEYSPELDRMLLADTVNDVGKVFAYDPEADEWEELLLDGAPTDSTLGYDLLDRDPQTGRYFLIRDANSHNRTDGVYTFRLTADVLDREATACPVDQCVGDGFDYASVQAAVDDANDGDVIGLEGEFEQCVVIHRPITLRALSGRPHIRDRVCDTKAVIVSKASGTISIEGIEVSGARDEKAIWHYNGAGTLIIRDVLVHDSGMGILAGTDARSLQIFDSEFHSMADPNELAHFVYAAEVRELIMENNLLRGGTDGHFIKAQSIDVHLRGNTIRQERYTGATLIDIWGCGENVLVGNDIRSADTTEAVNAVGITRRTREDRPCPVDRYSFHAEDNRYVKAGDRQWSSFVNNRFTDRLPTRNLIIRGNEITNAWLVSDKDRNYSQQQWEATFASDDFGIED